MTVHKQGQPSIGDLWAIVQEQREQIKLQAQEMARLRAQQVEQRAAAEGRRGMGNGGGTAGVGASAGEYRMGSMRLPLVNDISRAVTVAALLLWAATVVALALVAQNVTYTVCNGPLLRIPPALVHWPPAGQNLELLSVQHGLTLTAVGFSIIAAFLTLYALPHLDVVRRTASLIGMTVGFCLVGALVWLLGEAHVLHAHINALAQCL